jgi:hypothetical protein
MQEALSLGTLGYVVKEIGLLRRGGGKRRCRSKAREQNNDCFTCHLSIFCFGE